MHVECFANSFGFSSSTSNSSRAAGDERGLRSSTYNSESKNDSVTTRSTRTNYPSTLSLHSASVRFSRTDNSFLIDLNNIDEFSPEMITVWQNTNPSPVRTVLSPGQIALKRNINAVAAINSRLPVEIIAAIFEICCDNISARRMADLGVICAVCAHWRAVAVLTSKLWSTIHYHSNMSKYAVAESLRMSIIRSKSTPLTVDVSALGETTPEIESVAQLLRPHWWRCRLLDLTFTQESTARLFLPLPQTMPFLRYLSYTMESSWSVPMESIAAPTPADLSPLRLFETNLATCGPESIHIYVPSIHTLIIPAFSDLSSLKTLGLALNMPSAQMLDIAAQAPQLRTLDLMVHHPDPVENRVLKFAYPKLVRQRIAGDGCTSLVPAPHLQSLTLIDEASMRAVDQLMWSRTIDGSSHSNSMTPIFPRLRNLTFVFGGASDTQSSGRFDNLAGFIREHDGLSSLHLVAGWAPVPYLLDVSLLTPLPRSYFSGSAIANSRLSCPKLELLNLDMVLPIDFRALASVLESLANSRPGLRIELAVRSAFEVPDCLQAVCTTYPGQVVILARR